MRDDFFQTLATEDIEKVIESLKAELFGNNFIGANRIAYLSSKLKRYKEELVDRILMGIDDDEC